MSPKGSESWKRMLRKTQNQLLEMLFKLAKKNNLIFALKTSRTTSRLDCRALS